MSITEKSLELIAQMCGMSLDSITYAGVRAVYIEGLSKGEAAKKAGLARSGVVKGCQRIEEAKENALAVARNMGFSSTAKPLLGKAQTPKTKEPKVKWSFINMVGNTSLSNKCVCLYSNSEGQFLLRAETSRGTRARYNVVTSDQNGRPSAHFYEYEDKLVTESELDIFIEEAHRGAEFDRAPEIVARALEMMRTH